MSEEQNGRRVEHLCAEIAGEFGYLLPLSAKRPKPRYPKFLRHHPRAARMGLEWMCSRLSLAKCSASAWMAGDDELRDRTAHTAETWRTVRGELVRWRDEAIALDFMDSVLLWAWIKAVISTERRCLRRLIRSRLRSRAHHDYTDLTLYYAALLGLSEIEFYEIQREWIRVGLSTGIDWMQEDQIAELGPESFLQGFATERVDGLMMDWWSYSVTWCDVNRSGPTAVTGLGGMCYATIKMWPSLQNLLQREYPDLRPSAALIDEIQSAIVEAAPDLDIDTCRKFPRMVERQIKRILRRYSDSCLADGQDVDLAEMAHAIPGGRTEHTDPSETFMAKETLRMVEERLSRSGWQALMMSADGYTAAEIAALAGITPEAAKKRVQRARKLARSIFG